MCLNNAFPKAAHIGCLDELAGQVSELRSALDALGWASPGGMPSPGNWRGCLPPTLILRAHKLNSQTWGNSLIPIFQGCNLL